MASKAVNSDNNKMVELKTFPLLDLPPELPLKIYEILVKSDTAIIPRELMPAYRGKDNSAMAPVTTRTGKKQPAITKVSRQVRKDSLSLYYSLNIFMMAGTVTEHSALVPFSRYPKELLPTTLRSLRKVSCLVRIFDQCPNPASQKPQRSFNIDIVMTVAKSKTSLKMAILDDSYDTPTRRKWLLEETKRCVGQPDEDGFDGIYLLKAATYLFEGIVCKSHKPQWRDLGRLPVPVDSLFVAPPANVASNGAPIPVNPSALGPPGPPLSFINYFQQLLAGQPPVAPAPGSAPTQNQQPATQSVPTTASAITYPHGTPPNSTSAASATGAPTPNAPPYPILHSHYHCHHGGYSYDIGLASIPLSGPMLPWLYPPATNPQVPGTAVLSSTNATTAQPPTSNAVPSQPTTASANAAVANAGPMPSVLNGGALGPFPLGALFDALGGFDDHDSGDYDDYYDNHDSDAGGPTPNPWGTQ